MILAIHYIGKNGPISKEKLFDYLTQFSDKEEFEKKGKKSLAGATTDVLYNIRVLQFVTGDDKNLVLTSSLTNDHINLYSGKQVYAAYLSNDKEGALLMLQTNALYYSPEIRDLAAFIFRRKKLSKSDIGMEYDRKNVFGHSFNPFTIDTSLVELERLSLLEKHKIGETAPSYIIVNLHNLIFAQLLVEEYCELKDKDGTVPLRSMKERFSLKYNMNYPEFDERFSILKNSLLPDLIVGGSYEKFSINMDIAQELNLYE
ncbi:hypothetical protein E2N92_00700 [Methanofollis formosanus]|uniref:Uncharacterized protein n=1 Tax=Methanofollis formosanus TaxID=299308 RepID=A0A8G0ZYE0_9EURY|nr:hypothetical protein [Methanofollis formosanus]QYZ78051.1 hypothetical protein E2N92_00700 [Methanofollis formosanus]